MNDTRYTDCSSADETSAYDSPEASDGAVDDPVFHMILSAIEEELDKLAQEEPSYAHTSPLEPASEETEEIKADDAPEPTEPERGTAAYDHKHRIPWF